jgi:hypothetical protein
MLSRSQCSNAVVSFSSLSARNFSAAKFQELRLTFAVVFSSGKHPTEVHAFGSNPTEVHAFGSNPTEVPMTPFSKAIVGTAMGAGIMAFSALSASAAVVCTGDVCWHTQESYEYPSAAHVIIHDDAWRAGPGITFREHEGRGYWSGERWTEW